uniref:MATH domain-containing protein n=1 Tax=Globodera rostochiensis TaxID=31243 RepID=A0A914I199_GLORO
MHFSDPYKANGNILLTIEKVSEFARGHDKNSSGRRFSDAVYIRGLPWKIYAIPPTVSAQKHLGFFLQCNSDSGNLAGGH